MQACTQGRKSNFQAFLLWVRLAFKFINLAYGSQLGTRGVSPCKEITTHTGAPAHKKAQTDIDIQWIHMQTTGGKKHMLSNIRVTGALC